MRPSLCTTFLTGVLLFCVSGARALAQEPPVQDQESHSAEEAFLKAYYLEQALRDFDKAATAYRRVAREYPGDRERAAKALLGEARCLSALGKHVAAKRVLAEITAQFADVEGVAAGVEALSNPSVDIGSGEVRVADLVRTAVVIEDLWDVAAYGDRGVPELGRLLRDPRPSIVRQAAAALWVVGTPAAHATLRDAVTDARTLYPALLLGVDGSLDPAWPEGAPENPDPLPLDAPVLKAAVASSNGELRTAALDMVFNDDRTAGWEVEAAAADPTLRKRYLDITQERAWGEGYAQLVVRCLGSDDETARQDAVASLIEITEGDYSTDFPQMDALLIPPDRTLTDRRALVALAEAINTDDRSAHFTTESDPLVAAALREPKIAAIALRWILTNKCEYEPTPEEFVAALGRTTLRALAIPGRHFAVQMSRAYRLLGNPPSAVHVRRLAEFGLFRTDRRELLESFDRTRTYDREHVMALLEGVGDGVVRSSLVKQIARRARGDVPEWIGDVVELGLASKTPESQVEAMETCARIVDEGGMAVDELVERVAPYVDHRNDKLAKHACFVLGRAGPAGSAALAARLKPGHPRAPLIRRALRHSGEPQAGDAVQVMLASMQDKEDVSDWASLLVELLNERAEPALAALVRSGDPEKVSGVLHAAALAPFNGADFPRFELFLLAIEQAPGAIDWKYCDPDRLVDDWPGLPGFEVEEKRRLAAAAIASPATRDRRWGVGLASTLLDPTLWDALMKTAEDLDPTVRDDSRLVLRLIRESEAELEELKSVGALRATRTRILELLASDDREQRLTGIAALAAARVAGRVEILLGVAERDEDPKVREEARKALLVIGRPTPGPGGK